MKDFIKQKKFIKSILLMIITTIFIFGLSQFVIDPSIQDKTLYSLGSTDQIQPLTNDIKLIQELNIVKGKINRISLQVATYGRKNDGEIILKIFKEGIENPITEKKLNISNFENNSFISFDFPTIIIKEDEKYYFTVETTSTDKNKCITLWINSSENDGKKLKLNNDEIEGKLAQVIAYKEYNYEFYVVSGLFILLSGIFAFYSTESNEVLNKTRKKMNYVFIILLFAVIIFNRNIFFDSDTNISKNICLVFAPVGYILYFLYYNNNYSGKYERFYSYMMILITPLISLIFIELFNGNILFNMDFKIILINYLCILMFYLFICFFTNKINIAYIIGNVLNYIVGLVYYYVLLFRGTPILPTDIYSLKTAANVINNYRFSFNILSLTTLLFMILICIMNMKIKFNIINMKQKILYRLSIIGIIMTFCLNANSILDKSGASVNLWQQISGYKNSGVVASFLMNTKYLKINKPNNYSLENVENIVSKYRSKSNENIKDSTIKPNIITIMNESFSDLNVIGNIETNEDFMPFINNLKNNTIKGNALVSVYGGGTSNTEWEFLTGNTMAFMPSGSNAYQQYIHENSDSLAQNLKSLNYNTIAIHPLHKNGWNRDVVYPLLGFDEFLSIDDFKNPEILRNSYISDSEDYKKIIEKYEEKDQDEKLFIFNVTIQNHGGYATDNSIFSDSINLKSSNTYSDVNEYLSLIKKSDEAFEELVNYFSNKDEPTLILMFGDHLPALNTKFYESIYGKSISGLTLEEQQRMYTVPFIIWTNYDIQEKNIDITSINYLSNLVLETASLPLSGYNEFLKDIQSKIPAINVNGIITQKRECYKIDDVNINNEIRELINDYNILQYNNIFDSNKNAELFSLEK